MDRKLRTFIAVLALSITISPILIIALKSAVQPSAGASGANNSEQPAQDKHPNANQSVSGRTEIAAAPQPKANTEPKGNGAKPDPSSVPINWNRVLAVIGIAALYIAMRSVLAVEQQTAATANAAQATLASVEQADRHFKLVNQQWLDTADWFVSFKKTSTGLEEVTPKFWITNPTKMAVTLVGYTTRFIDGAFEELVHKDFGRPVVLPPGRIFPGVCPAAVLNDLASVAQFKNDRLKLTLRGSIEYIDAFGQPQTLYVGRVCMCGISQKPVFTVVDGVLTPHDPAKASNEGQKAHKPS
jgi:hypothetical protein